MRGRLFQQYHGWTLRFHIHVDLSASSGSTYGEVPVLHLLFAVDNCHTVYTLLHARDQGQVVAADPGRIGEEKLSRVRLLDCANEQFIAMIYESRGDTITHFLAFIASFSCHINISAK